MIITDKQYILVSSVARHFFPIIVHHFGANFLKGKKLRSGLFKICGQKEFHPLEQNFIN